MMKKRLCFTAIMLVVMLTLAACGSGGQGAGPSEDTIGAIIAENLTMPEDLGATTDMETFATIDIYGNTVTNDIFADYELTMVYVWGTYCNPCIDALPTMEKIYGTYQDKGINVAGMLVDIQNADLSPEPGMIGLAREITEGQEVTFSNLLVPENLLNSVMTQVSVTPTIFLVDSAGKIEAMYEGSRSYEKWSEILDEKLDN